MSRSGYNDDCDGWALIRWRGAVASSIRGKRGQAFLRDMLAALDTMPEKRLIAGDLKVHEVNPLLPWLFARVPDPDDWDARYHWWGQGHPFVRLPHQAGVCALGALGDRRALDMDGVDPDDTETVGALFGIADPLAREVVYMNDEVYYKSPEERWQNMRSWIVGAIKPTSDNQQVSPPIPEDKPHG